MKRNGYAMLLILPGLLVLSLTTPLLMSPTHDTAMQQQQVLSDARQQLIGYAAAYLESYNPSGAGPGHLPCPDSDPTPDSYQVQLGLAGDGPNPPCGNNTIAIGKLPRHISRGKHRFAFHLEDKHALWYAVDTRFINNPVNRAVNPNSVGRIRFNNHEPAVAMVFIPEAGSPVWQQANKIDTAWMQQAFQGGQGSELLQASLSQTSLITARALLGPVLLRVALWLSDTFRADKLFYCADTTEPCQFNALQSCLLLLRDKVLLLMLDSTDTIQCIGSVADGEQAKRFIEDARLDRVFFRRHWFYRNDWWQFVDVQVDRSCITALIDCRARVKRSTNDMRILLKVVPVESVS